MEASDNNNVIAIISLRVLAFIAVLYNGWIIFRVVNDWLGLIAAIISVLLLPITTFTMPVIMFFVPSSAAGPLSLWPAIIFTGILQWLANKLNGSLT
jgi:hypothetical protein